MLLLPGGDNFSLHQKVLGSCAVSINKGWHVIVIGGKREVLLSNNRLVQRVHGETHRYQHVHITLCAPFHRYSGNGTYLGDLATLNQKRTGHACSVFANHTGTVSIIVCHSFHTAPLSSSWSLPATIQTTLRTQRKFWIGVPLQTKRKSLI